MPFTLYCVVDPPLESETSFSVTVEDEAMSVHDVKKAIKKEKASRLQGLDADQLTLWKVCRPKSPFRVFSDRHCLSLSFLRQSCQLGVTHQILEAKVAAVLCDLEHLAEEMGIPNDPISTHFTSATRSASVHIVVRIPQVVDRAGRFTAICRCAV